MSWVVAMLWLCGAYRLCYDWCYCYFYSQLLLFQWDVVVGEEPMSHEWFRVVVLVDTIVVAVAVDAVAAVGEHRHYYL